MIELIAGEKSMEDTELEFDCEGYDLEIVPKTVSNEEKTGITIKGKDSEYLEAQKKLKEFIKNKGERFLINGIEIEISDTPKNKPMIVGVKPRDGMSGKANLKFFDKNNRGGATIMIQKAKGGDGDLVKILGIKVIKYLLDGLMAGDIKEADLQTFKIKTKTVTGNKNCHICGREFRTEQGIKTHIKRMHVDVGSIECTKCEKTVQTQEEIDLHMKRVHTGGAECKTCGMSFQRKQELHLHMSRIHGKEEIYCEVCRVFLKGEEEYKKHLELEHCVVMSPVAKKRKHEQEDPVVVEENTVVDVEMKEVEENETLIRGILRKQNDEKVLEKQQEWFEKEVKFQEMKRKMSEEQRKLENKRKRQSSIRKKKNSEVKLMMKEVVDDRTDISVEAIRNKEEEEVKVRDAEGPGYMGWSIAEKENENLEGGLDIKRAQEDIKSLYKLYQGVDTKLKDAAKQMNSLRKEVKHLEEEYKQCVDALATETYERNKAEAMNKVLLETIDAQKRLKPTETEISEADMSVDETESQSSKQQKYGKENCNQCEEKFKTNSDLDEHIKSEHVANNSIKCDKCNEKYSTVTDIERHLKEEHTENTKIELSYNCNDCEQKFGVEEDLKVHMISFHAEKVYNCQKCNKPYTSMSLLRRHDWRCHKEIDCNMCGDTLESRGDIKKHREQKHKIYQKTYCKFYPNCIDGDECLFEHAQESNDGSNCPKGKECDDQSCKFSEQRHLTNKVFCKFQTNCNRLNCSYIHNNVRKAFLEEGLKRILIN